MKKTILITGFLLFTWFTTFIIGMKVGINGTEKRYEEALTLEPSYTGKDIQDAVNDYRLMFDLPILETDPELCNNLFDRYAKMLSEDSLTTGHPGFDAWADLKIQEHGYTLIGEVFSPAPTVETVINGWANSPGHNAAISNEEYTRVCTYAGDRGVVMVLGAI